MTFNSKDASLTLLITLLLLLFAPTLLAQNGGHNRSVDERLDHIDKSSGVTSDITLSTAELAIEVAINNNVSTHLSLLYEEDQTTHPEVDEGRINIQLGNSPYSINAGQFYLPFGRFESNLISEPLTQTMGEIRESAIQLIYEHNNFNSSLFIFNGTAEASNDNDEIDSYGASIGFNHIHKNIALTLNFAYLSNLADSDTLQDAITDSSAMSKTVGGASFQTTLSINNVTLIGEYLAASSSFESTDLMIKGTGAKPSSSNFEFAFDFTIANRDATLAIAIQSTDEALQLGLAAHRSSLSYRHI